MDKLTPTAFEVLAKQYRDWCSSAFGVEHGLPVAEDALASAKLAVVDVAIGDFLPGDYVLVWDRGIVHGPVGSTVRKRLCAWAGNKPSVELLHDVQDSVRVIWERLDVNSVKEERERKMFGCTAAAIDETLAAMAEPRDIARYAMGTLSNAQELIRRREYEGTIEYSVRDQDADTIRQLINIAKYAIDKAVPR